MAFYDLPEDERVALTLAAIAGRRTIHERWDALAGLEASPWDARAEVAGAMLAGCRSIVDLGCGTMALEHHLGAAVRYIPVDVTRRDGRTIVIDLNREQLPSIDADGWAVLGVLEYLFDVPALLRQLHATVVVSYNIAERSLGNRLSHGWVSAYDAAGLERLFADAGFAVVRNVDLAEQRLWLLTRDPDVSRAQAGSG